MRRLIFHRYSPTSLVRWMGAEGFAIDDVRAVLARLGCQIADSTMLTQWLSGIHGYREAPPVLSADEVAEIRRLLQG